MRILGTQAQRKSWEAVLEACARAAHSDKAMVQNYNIGLGFRVYRTVRLLGENEWIIGIKTLNP